LHTCQGTCSVLCEDDLVGSIRLYIKLIKKFCPGLEKLTICASLHEFAWPHADPEGLQTEHEAVLSLLENEIREIDSLKELIVLGAGDHILEIAKEACKWFSERDRQRIIRVIKKEQAKAVLKEGGNSGTGCEFCGEGHSWAECYNLCDCGEYGHLLKDCSRFII